MSIVNQIRAGTRRDEHTPNVNIGGDEHCGGAKLELVEGPEQYPGSDDLKLGAARGRRSDRRRWPSGWGLTRLAANGTMPKSMLAAVRMRLRRLTAYTRFTVYALLEVGMRAEI